jgi:seryl-tRNA synthetase
MNVKLLTIIESQKAIEQLLDKHLPVKTAYRLQKALRKVIAEINEFNQARQRLMEQMSGDPDENGNISVKEELIPEYKEKIQELIDQDVELEGVFKISINELEGLDFTIRDMMYLDFLIEDSE